jgi:hypothetical protein
MDNVAGQRTVDLGEMDVSSVFYILLKEAEVGSNGLGPSRTPAAAVVVVAFVVVFVALRRAASPAQRAVAAASASSLFLSSSVD